MNWKTTLGGILLSVSMLLGQAGVKIGHVGNTDFVGLAGAVGALLAGVAAKDASNTDPKQ